MNEQIIERLKQFNIPVFYGWYDDSIKDTFLNLSDNNRKKYKVKWNNIIYG